MKNVAARITLLWLVTSVSGALAAQPVKPLALAPMFTEMAVLQRDQPLKIWGTGQPGSELTVTLSETTATTSVAVDGTWQALLPPISVRRTTMLTVTSSLGQRDVRSNVAVGDVWLCSGQSNMEFEVRKATNADQEIERSADDGLRLFLVPRHRSAGESGSFSRPTTWASAAPASVREFSATCYFMGRELRARSDVPIGLIATSWGGSPIEDWLSAPTLHSFGRFGDALEQLASFARDPKLATQTAEVGLRKWMMAQALLLPKANNGSLSVSPSKGLWEEWGLPALASFDGFVRYRATVSLTRAQVATAQKVSIGRVDDIDLTRVNGIMVGTTFGWDKPRSYPLTSQQLVIGTNVIEILVMDTGGGGGVWGPEPRGVVLGDKSVIPFDDLWQASIGPSLAMTGSPPALPSPNAGLATLHNGMIAPLGSYTVKGFAWYQGEANAGRAADYPSLLSALIRDWRARFGGKNFLVVQLANFGKLTTAPENSHWAELREAQRRVVEADPDASLIPAIDIGDLYDIHPTNKREVGRRLALAALTGGPRIGTGLNLGRSGDLLRIDLNRAYHIAGGTAYPPGFELCDAQGRCRYVTATLAAPGRIEIAAGASDTEVRYLWANSPLVGLFDRDNIPLPPFRIKAAK